MGLDRDGAVRAAPSKGDVMKRTNRFWIAALLLGAMTSACAIAGGNKNEEMELGNGVSKVVKMRGVSRLFEIGQGTFRIKQDANGEFVAWFWRGSTQPNVEHWITRKNEYVEPTPNNTQKLIFYPVTDDTEKTINDYATFKAWVMAHGDGKDNGVGMAELGKHHKHTVVTENVNP